MPSLRTTGVFVIVACFLFGMVSRGLAESFTVFLLPLSADFGWPRKDLTGVYSLIMLTTGLASPFAGHLFDRWGPRGLYVLGIAALAGGLLTASVAAARWQFYLGLSIPVGFATASLGNVPHTALLSRWFDKSFSTVTAVVYSAMGVGTFVMLPLSQIIIDAVGWRDAYRWLAGLAIVGLGALILVLPWKTMAQGKLAPPEAEPDRAAPPPTTEPWTARRVVATPAFWGLFSVYFFTALGIYAMVVQAVAYLTSVGYAPLTAASTYGSTGMLTPVGMLGAGWLADRLGRRNTVMATYALTLTGLLILYVMQWYPAHWLLPVFVVCMGLTLGSRGPLISTTTATLFRGPNVGAILGAVSLGGGLGGASGSLISGALYDWTGGYNAVLLFAIFGVAMGSTPFWLVRALSQR